MPDQPAEYRPIAGNGDPISLAVLKSEIVHGFEWLDRRLSAIETEQSDHGKAIAECKTEIAILKVTALRIDTVRLSALVGSVVVVVLGLATVITKVAGLW